MMRKVYWQFLAFICLPALVNAQVIISGKWKRYRDEYVCLYRIEHGRLEEMAAIKPERDSSFGFYFHPQQEGFYVIGTEKALDPKCKYYFYFKKQDQLNIRFNDSTYVLTGKKSPENQALEQWHNTLFPLENRVYHLPLSTYVDFFPALEKIINQVPQTKFVPTRDKHFDEEFALFRELDLLHLTGELLTTPRTVHPKKEDFIPYVRNIETARFTSDTRLLRYPFGIRVIDELQLLPMFLGTAMENAPGIAASVNNMVNDTLKGEIVLQYAAYLKAYAGYEELYQQYGKYLLTADQTRRANDIKTDLEKKGPAVGSPAINFTYPDINGKKVSLTDFKGKIVVVDVWATWCGPCKSELPPLKQLEKEMHGQDVVFMSVSIDEEKDYQKWKDFVAKEELGGQQLFANGGKDLTKIYRIKGIPRFMVFDKKGNIVSTDAPRPSESELKTMLENELKK